MSYESLGIKDYENFPNNENNPIIDIRVKYHNPKLNHFVYIEKGDWIDMYTAERVFLKKGDFRKISLGVSIELPEGYEAIMAERSSTFERYGIIQANGIAIFDRKHILFAKYARLFIERSDRYDRNNYRHIFVYRLIVYNLVFNHGF